MINRKKWEIRTIRAFFKLPIAIDRTLMIEKQNDHQLSFWLEA